jgi:hypothetical protein
MLSCLLLWLRHSSRQLLCPAPRFVLSSFIALHYFTFAHPPHMLVTFGLYALRFFFSPFGGDQEDLAHNHKLHSLLTQGSFHYIPFHSFPLSLSRLQYTRCPCCARLRLSSGLRAVMIFASRLVGHRSTNRFQQPIAQSKKSRQPLFGAAAPHNPTHIPRGLPHGSLPRSFVPQFALLAHTLPPARGIHFTPFRSPLGGSHSYEGPPHF